MVVCRYCQQIHATDQAYPLRKATKDVESDYPRCNWHWRFVCSICGRPRHFNGITWCERTKQFICISCTQKHKLVQHAFWQWKTHYALKCKNCSDYHPTLDYQEFTSKHPWQLHKDMQEKHTCLDNEDKLSMGATTNIAQRKAVTERRTAQAWDELADRWSSHYTVRGDKNRQYVVDPAIFRIIGSVEGSSILDAGCGNGYLCRLLAKRGAKPVGVDISKRFIEIAKQKEAKKPLGIAYHVGSLSNLFMLQDEAFDLVISNLVLMDVRHLAKAVKEFHRILKKEGKLIFSVMHPCFSSPPVFGWVRKPVDSQRKEDWLYWKVDRYFDRIMEIWQFNDDCPKAYSFHRPLSDYVKLLIEDGFAITDFEEPTPTRKAVREHYRQFGNECDRIPWFLVIGARKTIG